MLDFFFKSYFVFFKRKMDQGAAAAVILLAIPLGLNVYMLVLLGLSFLINLHSLGGPLFGLMGGALVIALGLWLRDRYVEKKGIASCLLSKMQVVTFFSELCTTFFQYSSLSGFLRCCCRTSNVALS
jgi:hypothetical protein